MSRSNKYIPNHLKEKVIEEIKDLSIDGVAPCNKIHSSLYQRAYKAFGTWETACRSAGVKTIKMLKKEKLNKTVIESNFYLDRLLIAIRIAEKQGLNGIDTIDNCMKAAREGLVDHYKIIEGD